MIKKLFGSFAVTAFFAAPLFVACGSSSSGVSSGVDKTKKGSDLSTEEAQDVCKAYFDYQADTAAAPDVDAACQLAAFGATATAYALNADKATDADLLTACNQAVDDCKAAAPADDDGSQQPTDPAAACDSVNDAVVDSCTSTVADIETCLTEVTDAQNEALAALADAIPSCDKLTVDYFKNPPKQETPETPEPSEACKSVQADCAAVAALLASGLPGGSDDSSSDDGGGAGPDEG